MRKTITLREANQAFARCVREVEAGPNTSSSETAARLLPIGDRRVLSSDQQAARVRTREGVAHRGWTFRPRQLA